MTEGLSFSSLSPYSKLEVLSAQSASALRDQISQIKTPIKIINIVVQGTRFYAFIIGDVRVIEKKRTKNKEPIP